MRGLLVALVGLALVELKPPVAVILAYYGLLFCWRRRCCGCARRCWPARRPCGACAGPVLSHLLRAGRRAWPGRPAGLRRPRRDPGELLRELALTGYYPVLPWLTYLLAGMAVGRLDLRSPRVGGGAARRGAGLAVAAVGGVGAAAGPGGGAAVLGADLSRSALRHLAHATRWWWLAVEAPHTGTPFDLAHTTGTALAVLGAMLLLARAAPALVWPLAAVGAMPLTLYTLHVTALAVVPVRGGVRRPGSRRLDAAGGSHLVAALVIGVTVRAAGRRGPLEAVVARRVGRGASRRRRYWPLGRSGAHSARPVPAGEQARLPGRTAASRCLCVREADLRAV